MVEVAYVDSGTHVISKSRLISVDGLIWQGGLCFGDGGSIILHCSRLISRMRFEVGYILFCLMALLFLGVLLNGAMCFSFVKMLRCRS